MVYITSSHSLEITGNTSFELSKILTPDALDFISRLEREFSPARIELLEKRSARQRELDEGALPNFVDSTKHIRKDR
ncbi:malate synthase A, partial [bacterium]|nr:malate synthase A [bacterium]